MILAVGNIVRLSDGTYDEVVGFNNFMVREYGPGTLFVTSEGRLLDEGLFDENSILYSAYIIGHAWPKHDRTNGVAVSLYVLSDDKSEADYQNHCFRTTRN